MLLLLDAIILCLCFILHLVSRAIYTVAEKSTQFPLSLKRVGQSTKFLLSEARWEKHTISVERSTQFR